MLPTSFFNPDIRYLSMLEDLPDAKSVMLTPEECKLRNGKSAPRVKAKWMGRHVEALCRTNEGKYIITVLGHPEGDFMAEEWISRGERKQVNEGELKVIQPPEAPDQHEALSNLQAEIASMRRENAKRDMELAKVAAERDALAADAELAKRKKVNDEAIKAEAAAKEAEAKKGGGK